MKKICFIGNCQMLSLCIFFEELLDKSKYSVQWLCHHVSFHQHLGPWCRRPDDPTTFRCRVILDEEQAREALLNCDILVYQSLSVKASPVFSPYLDNDGILNLHCTKVSFPSIHFKLDEVEHNYNYMKEKEQLHNISVPLADYLLENYQTRYLLLREQHPTTLFFKYLIEQVVKQAELEMDLAKLNDKKYDHVNYLGLPGAILYAPPPVSTQSTATPKHPAVSPVAPGNVIAKPQLSKQQQRLLKIYFRLFGRRLSKKQRQLLRNRPRACLKSSKKIMDRVFFFILKLMEPKVS
ncbi:MAG: hypothetical protein JXX14_02555 [Deltaproteobacteria bacterium]|nr:hypothetical protein [Deltaproteobacteria bacterium]